MIAAPAHGECVAIVPGGPEVEAKLRAATGFSEGLPDPRRLGYCGREFRAYSRLSVAEAASFYSGVATLDPALLARYLPIAHLEGALSIRRMKRAYHRAFVLAVIAAASPDLLVVEGAEEFNEPPVAALLEEVLRRAPRAIVTCASGAAVPAACARLVSIEDVAART